MIHIIRQLDFEVEVIRFNKSYYIENVLLPFLLSSSSSNPTDFIVTDDVVSFEAVDCILSLSVRPFIDCALLSVLMSRKIVCGRR
jgi:hypothetical protein